MSLSEIGSGVAFGAALLSSGVYAPNVVKSQMTFSSNVMMMIMLGASATSAVILDIEHRLKLIPKKRSEPVNLGFFPYDGNVIGGILIGIGMAVTGSCPGTVLVQVGIGTAHGFAVLAGGLLGAMAFTKMDIVFEKSKPEAEHFEPTRERPILAPILESKTTPEVNTETSAKPFALVLVWVPMCLAVMRLVFAHDRSVSQIPQFGVVPPASGGLLIGVAQLVTTLLTKHTLGTSAGLADVAHWIEGKLRRRSGRSRPLPPLLTPSVVFSCGVVALAAICSHIAPKTGTLDLPIFDPLRPSFAAKAIAGGFAMGLGSRISKGCPSGHGISGLARFSLPSAVTTGALFLAGILTAKIDAPST